MALLLRVPLVVHLESLVNQLANLKHYEVRAFTCVCVQGLYL